MDEKIMFGEKEITLSLTGNESHKSIIEAGQGSFYIETEKNPIENYDALVKENDKINWDAFNGFYTYGCLEYKDRYPYGDWPRFFRYTGNDTGFIEWSKKREIEDFEWIPQEDAVVDLKNARIYSLKLYTKNNKIELSLGDEIFRLQLCGNLENFKITECNKIPMLKFDPEYENNIASYKLPEYKALRNATELHITVSPLSSPFDCASLLQFPNLKALYLDGNMTNLSALKKLKNLEKIGLWNIPNLYGMPQLNSWKNLHDFVASNIEESGGKLLKKQLKELRKTKKFDYLSVEKLRTQLWFETNYGIPFSYLESKNEKKAISAYNVCLKSIIKSSTEEEIKNAIINFTNKINKLENIETPELDDVYTALCTIMKNSPIKIETKKWELWFNETRNF